MYKAPECYRKLIEDLTKNNDIGSRAETVVEVELGLFLLEYVGLDDEPITAIWALLSGTPLSHPRLANLSEAQQRAIANARMIVPHSARSSWLSALRAYIRHVPYEERNYTLTEDALEALDDTLVTPVVRPAEERKMDRQRVYRRCLEESLEFDTRERKYATAGTWYFRAETSEGVTQSNVVLRAAHVALVAPNAPSWLKAARPRQPFPLDMQELCGIAHDLDEREAELESRFTEGTSSTTAFTRGYWMRRWEQVELLGVADNALESLNGHLEINGWAHIAGMVASGKSTVAVLLAALIIKRNLEGRAAYHDASPPQRITLVVPDVDTALRLADQLNWWFRNSPESDEPVAVPLLGRTSRHKHLQTLYNSAAYQNAARRGQSHWAERWLSVVCPLQGALDSGQRENLNHQILKPGSEPCARLSKDPGKFSNPHFCPFFARCPAQQAYFDMPASSIWITTPGAMAVATLPGQLDDRRQVRLGDLVYEQSDLVIVDEADTVMEWFDRVYAEEVALTNGRDGVLDELDAEATDHMRQQRQEYNEWLIAVRRSSESVNKILAQTNLQNGRYETLKPWSKGTSFTPNALFYHLAQCLVVGQTKPSHDDLDSDAKRQVRSDKTRTIMAWCEAFLERPPLLSTPLGGLAQPHDDLPQLTADLFPIARQIEDRYASAADTAIHNECRIWVNRAYQAGLDGEEGGEAMAELPAEVADALAYRLQFALTVRLLDWHTRMVFVEWYKKPPPIEAEQPHRRIPRGLLNVLPLPPEGQQYGSFLTNQHRETAGRPSPSSRPPGLAMFAYTSIGRAYLLNFHKLRAALDGRPGPNVLALSGTSYLPDSTRFHVGSPQAVLQSEANSRIAIAQSCFAFVPLRNRDNQPLRVSGLDDKEGALQQLVRGLCEITEEGEGGITQEYKWLKAREGEAKWRDRTRILMFVNSYDQAEATRMALEKALQGNPELRDSMRALQRTEEGDAYKGNVYFDERGVLRADAENFALTRGKILVAPLSAVGRGVNILNADGKAAFGAVYFLVRPMPHPADATAIAQEVNRRTLDWVQDPNFIAWQADGVERRARELRRHAGDLWRSAERRTGYRSLLPHPTLGFNPRHDLAATTAGLIIQAVGRLVRGGVPFHAYFADAAWAPQSALLPPQPDTEATSLLIALRERLQTYAKTAVGETLYGPLVAAMNNIKGLHE